MRKSRSELPYLVFAALVALVSFLAFCQLRPLEQVLARTVFEPPRAPPAPLRPGFLTSGQQLQSWLEAGDAVPLDVRSREAFEQGHLPAARHLNLDRFSLDQGVDVLRKALGHLGLTGRERVVLYGDSADLPRLGRAFWWLELAGVERLSVLREGHDGWYLAGGALETTTQPPVPVSFELPARVESLVSLEWLRHHFGLAGIEVLDVRDLDSWSRPDYEAPPRFAAGHVPMSSPAGIATWVEDGLPSGDEVWQRLLALGPRPEAYIDLSGELVLYGDGEGEGDDWLGLGYLLLREAGVRARIFAPGWDAWSACDHCPKMKIVTAVEVASRLAEARAVRAPEQESPVIMDLREERAYNHAHPPGALLVPAYDIERNFERALARLELDLDLDRPHVPLVLYCYGRSCVRSREASSFAARHGFLDLWWLRDGLEGWPEEVLPLARILSSNLEMAP